MAALEALFDVATTAGGGITAFIAPGTNQANSAPPNGITRFFSLRGITIATGSDANHREGIDFWIIETDFIVS
jgi:hypothetical protein